MDKHTQKKIIGQTKKWVETFIIGLNLCPFAKAPYLNNSVRFSLVEGNQMQAFVEAFAEEIDFLDQHRETETTLLIIPILQTEQDYFRSFLDFCTQTLALNDRQEDYQLVSFHPQARFEGYPPSSPKNLTAMAPYPILHILRTESVEKLGARMKKDVQQENDKTLSKLSTSQVEALWKKILS